MIILSFLNRYVLEVAENRAKNKTVVVAIVNGFKMGKNNCSLERKSLSYYSFCIGK